MLIQVQDVIEVVSVRVHLRGVKEVVLGHPEGVNHMIVIKGIKKGIKKVIKKVINEVIKKVMTSTMLP